MNSSQTPSAASSTAAARISDDVRLQSPQQQQQPHQPRHTMRASASAFSPSTQPDSYSNSSSYQQQQHPSHASSSASSASHSSPANNNLLYSSHPSLAANQEQSIMNPQSAASNGYSTPQRPQRQRDHHHSHHGGSAHLSGGRNNSHQSSASSTPSSHHQRTPGSSLTTRSYFATSLAHNDEAGYRAAGIIAFHRGEGGEVRFLFGCEGDASSKKKFGRLNLLGGKIDDRDNGSASTAAREFIEESGALLGATETMVERINAQQHGCMWYRNAKYVLYLHELTTPEEINIVSAYTNAKAAAVAEGRQIIADHSEMSCLTWIDGKELIQYLGTQRGRRDQDVVDDPVRTCDGVQFPMMSFTVSMLNTPCLMSKLRDLVELAPNSSPHKSHSQHATPDDDSIVQSLSSLSLNPNTPLTAASSSSSSSIAPSAASSVPPAPSFDASVDDGLSFAPYYSSQLSAGEAARYGGAGVLAFRRVSGKVQFLFGRCGFKGSKKSYKTLTILGGRRDHDDTHSVHTAAREFVEESGGSLLNEVNAIAQRILDQNHGVMWYRAGRYVLHLYEVTSQAEIGLADSYKHLSKKERESIKRDKCHNEMLDLHWVDGETLLTYLSSDASMKRTENENRIDDRIECVSGKRHSVYSYVICILRQACLRPKLTALVRGSRS